VHLGSGGGAVSLGNGHFAVLFHRSVSVPPPVTLDMGISSVQRYQSSHRKGLCGRSAWLAAPPDFVVVEESPLLVNLFGAPRGPSSTTSAFGSAFAFSAIRSLSSCTLIEGFVIASVPPFVC
jgi:hypothetical protein